LGAAEAEGSGPAELLLTNANVITMDATRPAARAVAIRQGRILAVGTDDEVERWAGPATATRNLDGRTLLPGLYDSHNHMLRAGHNLSEVDLSRARTLGDVLAAIGARAAASRAGDWVTTASRWHESQLAEGRFPRREELDHVAPRNPVLIRRGGHNVVVNSLAFQRAGITRDTPNPPEGTYVRDPETGELTGQVTEVWAFRRILDCLPPPTTEDHAAALRAIMRVYAELGITSVIEPGLYPAEIAGFRLLAERGEITTRTSMMWRFEPGTTPEALDAALVELTSGRVVPDLADPWLRMLAIKMSADGGVEAGYYREPYTYTDDPHDPRGKIRISLANLTAFATEAARRGWQVGVHCVGDAAADTVLDAYEAVDAVVPIGDKRWTMIHLMNPRPEHWARINRLRLAITAQQPLVYSLGGGFLKYIGAARTWNLEPLRAYLAHCRQPVGGGSDGPTAAYQPMLAIWSMVTRMTEQVGVQGPEWAVTPAEALWMYTYASAWCGFDEQVKGSIAPGKYADLVALSADPRAVEPDAIKEIQALLTLVDGRVVYEREGAFGAAAAPLVRATAREDDPCCAAAHDHDEPERSSAAR
jgi:predicted amidohydrolase YtcJ